MRTSQSTGKRQTALTAPCFSVALGTKPRMGTWKLRASDREARDTGNLEGWTFKSQ